MRNVEVRPTPDPSPREGGLDSESMVVGVLVPTPSPIPEDGVPTPDPCSEDGVPTPDPIPEDGEPTPFPSPREGGLCSVVSLAFPFSFFVEAVGLGAGAAACLWSGFSSKSTVVGGIQLRSSHAEYSR